MKAIIRLSDNAILFVTSYPDFHDLEGCIVVDAPSDIASKRYCFDGTDFVPDLAAYRTERWSVIKDARDAAEHRGCETALGRVDTDPDSQRKISGAVQMAMIAQAAGASFALDWTMQDNSTVSHDAAAMIALGVAVGQRVAACHAEGSARRSALANAADAPAIGAVLVDTGWPI